MKYTFLIFVIPCIMILTSCHRKPENKNNEITVFCAAGLSDVISELRDSFDINRNVDIKIHLASSGTLARQLEQGNNADIYISASKQWADYTDSLGLFSDRKHLFRNSLVFICPLSIDSDSIHFTDKGIPEFNGRLSMGDPSHVPAGQYAVEALINLGWWDGLKDRTLPAKNVRSALTPVELGECELGIVYYSDALVSKKIKVLGTFPEDSHTPIIFSAQLSKAATPEAIEFYNMLNNNNFDNTWMKYGLTPVTEN